ncbi:uncharacterized protein LOC118754437, partial [Rhagoletis pomonella]|uniref:uncharacterized protein LOC118754437 n=1 Tax=Rhagoletis pomonella TaxID=28610 RepID=UPI00177BA9DD
ESVTDKSDVDSEVVLQDGGDKINLNSNNSIDLDEVVQVDPITDKVCEIKALAIRNNMPQKMVIKKRFATSANFNQAGAAEFTNLPTPKAAKIYVDSSSDSTAILAQILENQKTIITNQQKFDERLQNLEKARDKNAIDNTTLMAQNQTIRECKVLVSKVLRSVGRLTGELGDEMQIEIAATLPLASIAAAKDVEEKLEKQEYFESMKIYLFQMKGSNETVDDVFRRVMTDELAFLFNFDGRKEKRALTKLKLINQVARFSQLKVASS